MIEKIDTSLYSLPSSRASQSGVGGQRSLMVANKINQIIDELSGLATSSGLTELSNSLKETNQKLTEYIKVSDFPQGDVIADVQSSGANITILNLTSIQLLGTQMDAQTKTINKILSVMRTRKEIKT